MRSHGDTSLPRELIDKIILLLLAVALNALEFFIPRVPFFPWLKPGLANIVTMIWIIRYGTIDALVYSIVRSWIAGCYFGFSLVSLSLALSGGILATLAMGVLWSLLGKRGLVGCVGLGVTGALFHNLGQLASVYALLTTNDRIFYQIPVMAIASVVFGSSVGALVLPVMRMLDRKAGAYESMQRVTLPHRQAVGPAETVITAGLFALSFALVFVSNTMVLAGVAIATATSVGIVYRGDVALLLQPFRRFWTLFLFIALVYMVVPYGTRFERFSFLTHESVTATVQQWLRLYTWLALSSFFAKFRFHVVLFTLLARVFRTREVTLSAGLIAFEFFPLVAAAGKKQGKAFFTGVLLHPIRSLQQKIDELYGEVLEKVRGAERDRIGA